MFQAISKNQPNVVNVEDKLLACKCMSIVSYQDTHHSKKVLSDIHVHVLYIYIVYIEVLFFLMMKRF